MSRSRWRSVGASDSNRLPQINSGSTSGNSGKSDGLYSAFPNDPELGTRGVKPKVYMCYLCGQVHSSAHYLAHVPQCELRFTQAESLKPPEERRVLPDVPPEVESGTLPMEHKEIEAFNTRMSAIYDKLFAVTCLICANSFGPEAFKRHSKLCTIDTPMGVPKPKPKIREPPKKKEAGRDLPFGALTNLDVALNAQAPIAYTCYLCGMQYGSASLHIHIPQCMKKWLDTEARKPRELQRKIPPPPPEVLSGLLPKEPAEVEAFNKQMTEIWETRALTICPFCSRGFREDAFLKHQKVCTAENPGGPLGLKKTIVKSDTDAALDAVKLPMINTTGGGGSNNSSPTKVPRHSIDTSPRMPPINKGKVTVNLPDLPPVVPTEGKPAAAKQPEIAEAPDDAKYRCFLCGEMHSSMMLFVHIAQDIQRWQAREAARPRNLRLPTPAIPEELTGVLPTDLEGIAAFNNKMAEVNLTLVTCPGCRQTFSPMFYEEHFETCADIKTIREAGPDWRQGLEDRVEYRPASDQRASALTGRELHEVVANLQAKLETLQAQLQEQHQASKPTKASWFGIGSLFARPIATMSPPRSQVMSGVMSGR